MSGRSTDSHSDSEPGFESTRCHFKDWEIVFSSSNLGKDGVNIIWLKSTKSGPVGFEKMDFSHFSPCSMQWMFQTPGVSIVHVQKTVSYNNL